MRHLQRYVLITLLPAFLLSVSGVMAESQDLSSHPVYSKYEFGRGPKVIDFGIQPLAVPIGVTTEVMKRDRVLRTALSRLGMEIRFHPFMKGSDLNYFLRQGDIEGAVAGDMPAITIAAETGITVAALAKRGFSSIVSRGQMQISELKGLRVGYPEGSTAHYTLLIALAQYGMTERDLVMVPLEVDKLTDALSKGNIDAFSAFEPVPSMALAENRDFTVIMRYLNSSYLYFSSSFAEQNRDAAAAILASHVRALRWMKKDMDNLLKACQWNRDAARKFSEKETKLTVTQIADIVKSDILDIATSPVIPDKDLSEEGYVRRGFELLKKQNRMSREAVLRKVLASFDNTLISDILAHPKKFRLNDFDYE